MEIAAALNDEGQMLQILHATASARSMEEKVGVLKQQSFINLVNTF